MERKALIPLFMFSSLLISGCVVAQQLFSEEEKAIILTGMPAQDIMRLYTTDNPDDSVLLRQIAMPVTADIIHSEPFGILCLRMLATVRDPTNEGVGIAAPQVGISRRLIAVRRLDKEGNPFELYANPVITNYGEERAKGQEGCLSIPEQYGVVERSQQITIEYTDLNDMTTTTEHISGFTAVIFQHEIDHLNGILFTDRCDKE